MYLPINIELDEPFFDDCIPESKSENELVHYVLADATGKKCNLKKYSAQEINMCVRQLIQKGYLRGTVLNFNQCSWSKLTSKGKHLLKLFENLNHGF